MDPRVQQNRRTFFSQPNEAMLYGMLSKNFQERMGSALNEKQSARLERALEHYMSEVFQVNSTMPVQSLNKEVISATAQDFSDYLQRQEAAAVATPQMFQETAQRYDQLQQDRQRSLEAPRPVIPEYIQAVTIKEDDSVSALSLFEEAKKRRNMEMNAQAETQIAKRSAAANQPLYLQDVPERPDPRSMYDRPLDMVVAGQNQELPGRGDGNPTIARPGQVSAARGSLQQDIIIKQEDIQSYKEIEYNLSVYSADRRWEVDTNNGENRFNFSVNLYSGNPTNGLSIMPKGIARLRNIVRIEFVKAIVPIEVTDMLIRKTTNTNNPNLITSVATAYAIGITSVNAGNSTDSTGAVNLVARALENVRNFNELSTLAPGQIISYDTSFVKTIFSFPFVTLNVDELDTNNYGTNNSMDNAFGILQYDSTWSDNTNSMGFTSLIPKYLKCQRVYSPTPLSTLNKLTIRLQQPNGQLVNSTSDTLDISGVFLSITDTMLLYFNTTTDISGTCYRDTTGEYIWLDCKQWFGRYQLSIGDRIQVRNLTAPANATPALIDIVNYIQRPSGHTVIGTAYTQPITAEELSATGLTGGSVPSFDIGGNIFTPTEALIDGHNDLGYSKFIVIRSQFADPTTGSMSVLPFGGAPTNSDLATALITPSTEITPGKLINLSRQTQLIFRIITREYDSSSIVRPDNL